MIHKWLHYFEVYERHVSPFRGRRVTLLEIGVSHGGSLEMWRHYLGRRATIVGIDISPRVAELASPGIDVLVGDQSDESFLEELVQRYGSFDVIIDDGSHFPEHQKASIEYLWPHLNDGGIYVVEDLHSNYWSDYGGRVGSPETFIAWLGHRIDDMHAFHSRDDDFVVNDWTRTLNGLHVYDSIAVLDKHLREPLENRRTGRPVFDDIYGTQADSMIDEYHRRQLESLGRPMARVRRTLRDPRGAYRRATARFKRDDDM
jgi:23S rRNA U2552 (ribose-2'-O)-methylase RlmE/FtsJ